MTKKGLQVILNNQLFMDWPNLYMYKQSKSREKRRIMLAEYSPSPETAAEALCPPCFCVHKASMRLKTWKQFKKETEECTQGWERWLAGRDLGILVYLASQRRLSGGWMLNQEPPGRKPISEVVFSLANRNIPCHQTWSEFLCQVHALAMSCHHRWDTPTFLSKRNPGAWYN